MIPPPPHHHHCSQGNRSETGLQKRALHVPFSPVLSLPGFFCVHNSAGTAEITTLPGDVAIFKPIGKDKDICLSLSPQPRFSKMICGYPSPPPLLSGLAVLETGIQRQGRMSSVLNVPHVKESCFDDKSISSDLSLCPQVDVVQKDELLPSLTLTPIRWKKKLMSFSGE